jgi:hypothetical protein
MYAFNASLRAITAAKNASTNFVHGLTAAMHACNAAKNAPTRPRTRSLSRCARCRRDVRAHCRDVRDDRLCALGLCRDVRVLRFVDAFSAVKNALSVAMYGSTS